MVCHQVCDYCGEFRDQHTDSEWRSCLIDIAHRECIHGLGPIAACVLCNGRAKREAEAVRWVTFFARWPGHCPGCNLPIMEGQTIAWRQGAAAHHDGCQP